VAEKPVKLSNGRAWPTQTAALNHFRLILKRYANEQVIDNASDHADLLALLIRYDVMIHDGPSKIGNGVDAFFRRRNCFDGGFSTSGFWVRRVDGSETDFSYVQAIKGRPRGDQEFQEACRVAVAADILAAKQHFFDTYADASGRVACELSGRLITFEEAHVDHVDPTFRQLVIAFRAARGWQQALPPGVLTAPADRQTQTRFANPDIARAFREFHKVALLRVIAAETNSALAAKQQRPRVTRPVVLP
jgi:hypothetical protein